MIFCGCPWKARTSDPGTTTPPFLPSALFCGFRAFLVLPVYYPADLARCFGPFVDLLLTRA